MVAEYADFIFYVGMFTEKERDYFRNQTDEMRRLIQLERYAEAFEVIVLTAVRVAGTAMRDARIK